MDEIERIRTAMLRIAAAKEKTDPETAEDFRAAEGPGMDDQRYAEIRRELINIKEMIKERDQRHREIWKELTKAQGRIAQTPTWADLFRAAYWALVGVVVVYLWRDAVGWFFAALLFLKSLFN